MSMLVSATVRVKAVKDEYGAPAVEICVRDAGGAGGRCLLLPVEARCLAETVGDGRRFSVGGRDGSHGVVADTEGMKGIDVCVDGAELFSKYRVDRTDLLSALAEAADRAEAGEYDGTEGSE